MSRLKDTLEKVHLDFESSVSNSILEVMHRATDDLVASEHPMAALREGSMMPEFTLNDSAGNAVSSAQRLDQGPLIISFFRGFW